MPRLPLADWRTEQCRLTVFPMPDAGTRTSEWWEAVTDGKPDEATMSPKKGSGLIHGVLGPGKLILKLEPDRIDWLLTPQDPDLEALAEQPEFPTFGPAVEMLELFSGVAEKWLALEDIPAVGRMAFGAILVHPEMDRRAGYLRLPDYLPVQADPESSDFLYQINLPPVASATGLDGLRLNRLSRWSVARFKLIALRFTGATVAERAFPEPFALRIELDINTAPEFTGPIPSARLVEVYRELVGAARTIATNGVVPQ